MSVVFSIGACGDDGPRKSKAGESCLTSDDCAEGLACFSQVCLSSAPEPAEVPPPADKSARGATCNYTTECEDGLVCVPIFTGTGAIGTGRCDFESYGLTPTGKSCWAECSQAIDCCELPLSVMTADPLNTYRSCEDIAARLGTTPSACEGTAAGATYPRECFLYKAYCDCGAAPSWGCTAGQCVYTKTCEANGEAVRGCPLVTRTEVATPTTTCNTLVHTCTLGATATGCVNSDDCNGDPVYDDPTDTCSDNECVCLTSLGGLCYRQCDTNLDCARGYNCDVGQGVCVATGECDNDNFCKILMGDVTAVCLDSHCKVPCSIDQDCTGSGLGGLHSFGGTVCIANYCEALGCTSDAECETSGTVKKFCQTTPVVEVTATVRSAITD